jgi:hypothetical protein
LSVVRHPARAALLRSLPFAALLLLALALAGAAAAAPGRSATPAGPAPTTPLPCGQALWYQIAPSPANLVGAAAVALGGQVYVFGGDSANYAPLAQKYDPAADTWSALAPLPSGRTFASAVTDGSAIYILNGDTSSYGSAFLARYDPAANTYTALATPPHATAAQAAVYLNGRIYRIAGVTGFAATPVNTVDVYTIATNTWASAAAYPQAVGGLFAVAANGRIAAGGGTTAARTDTAKTYQYNPATNTWNDATLPDLPAARHYSASDVLHGRWIVAGGRESGGIAPTAWALDLSNPAGGWAALPDLENLYPGPGGAATADAFYIFGGDVNQPRAAERYEENLCATPVGSPSATPCAVGAWDARAPAPAALQGSGGAGWAGLPVRRRRRLRAAGRERVCLHSRREHLAGAGAATRAAQLRGRGRRRRLSVYRERPRAERRAAEHRVAL